MQGLCAHELLCGSPCGRSPILHQMSRPSHLHPHRLTHLPHLSHSPHSLTQSVTYLTHVTCLSHSVTHSLTHSLISLTHSLVSLTHSLVSLTHSLVVLALTLMSTLTLTLMRTGPSQLVACVELSCLLLHTTRRKVESYRIQEEHRQQSTRTGSSQQAEIQRNRY